MTAIRLAENSIWICFKCRARTIVFSGPVCLSFSLFLIIFCWTDVNQQENKIEHLHEILFLPNILLLKLKNSMELVLVTFVYHVRIVCICRNWFSFWRKKITNLFHAFLDESFFFTPRTSLIHNFHYLITILHSSFRMTSLLIGKFRRQNLSNQLFKSAVLPKVSWSPGSKFSSRLVCAYFKK